MGSLLGAGHASGPLVNPMSSTVFDWAILAISLTNVILLLWLGLTVLLNAERRTGGVWLVGCSLLLGSLFFMAHTAILGIRLDFADLRLDFWWRAGWLPLIAIPYAWYVIVLWYIDLRTPRAHALHLFGFGGITLLFVLLLLLFGFTSLLPTFQQVIALDFSSSLTLAGIPILLSLYPIYIVACMVLSLLALLSAGGILPGGLIGRRQGTGRWLSLSKPPSRTLPTSWLVSQTTDRENPFPEDRRERQNPQQQEARRRAHPWLIATTLGLLLVSLLVSVLIAWVFALARQVDLWPGISRQSIPWLRTFSGEITASGALGQMVAWFDLAIAALLLLATVLIGQAIVSYEVFSGRVLPRADLRRHWRNALILAVGYSGLVSVSLVFALPSVYLLLITAGLITLFYALLGWRTFQRHDQLMHQLRPFVRSQHLYEQVMATEPLDDEAKDTFQALCQNVLKSDYAVLAALGSLAPLIQPPLVYPNHAPIPDHLDALAANFTVPSTPPMLLSVALQPGFASPARSVTPLWGERGLIGLLLLGDKRDGGLYTQEELEVAQAIGERLIDTRASSEIARRLFTLQRQRLAESQLMDRQTRRALHDEVLPALHSALLTLSQGQAAVEPVQAQLALLHRQISNLLRNQQPASTAMLSQGLLPALQRLLDEEMRGMFDGVVYQIDEAAKAVAANLSDLAREVLYYAVREAVRNAARHGRGEHQVYPLHLHLTLTSDESDSGLTVCIEDDGVGLAEPACVEQGRGLALHRTLLAILGATFVVSGKEGGGVRAEIRWRP